jgi:hypothetical protein
MSFEIMHFRNADRIIKQKKMEKEVQLTLEYLDDCLCGTVHRGEIMRQALEELNWRMNGDLNILEGRRYYYKGFKKGIAIEGNFSSYEFIQDGLLRLQIGKDKGKIDVGILLLTSSRSDKSPYGSTKQLVEKEIEYLYPTISLPVSIVLFDLGLPYGLRQEEKNASAINPESIPDNAGNNQTKTEGTDQTDHSVAQNESQSQESKAPETSIPEAKAPKPVKEKKRSKPRKKKSVNSDANPETD